ncbi:glycosyltransferase [Aeromicrobium halocynthiae]|uniref:Glycosyltransferase n=1 Tax=Aeromicrobium halocynthiae TaxID=560557 RepID=A0ABP5HU79_9ACTN
MTVVRGRHEHLDRQRRGLECSTTPPADHVVVAMDDPELVERWRPSTVVADHLVALAAPAAGLPLAAARNLGARIAIDRGARQLIFLDVDCVPTAGALEAYAWAAATAEGSSAVLCGPVAYLPPAPPGGYDLETEARTARPHPARPAPDPGDVVIDHEGHHLFWSLSFSVGVAAWEATGGFDERYVGYGAEDTDFGQRAARAGLPLAWVGGATALHQYHPAQDPPVQHLDDILRNGRLFAETWGWWPMKGWLEAFEARGLVRRDGRGGWESTAERGSP